MDGKDVTAAATVEKNLQRAFGPGMGAKKLAHSTIADAAAKCETQLIIDQQYRK